MTTSATDDVMSPDLLVDTQAVIDHLISGTCLDPEIAQRVRERADHIREDIRQQHGILDIGVPALRELRDTE